MKNKKWIHIEMRCVENERKKLKLLDSVNEQAAEECECERTYRDTYTNVRAYQSS